MTSPTRHGIKKTRINLSDYCLRGDVKTKRRVKRYTYNLRSLKGRHSYSISDISQLFVVHVRTAQRWHMEGMTPIDPEDRPLLFLGIEVKRYLTDKRQARKCKLEEGQFYCPRCRSQQESEPAKIEIIETNRRIGLIDTLVFIKGICVKCGCRLTLFSTRDKAKTSVFSLMTRQADRVIEGDSCPSVNADKLAGEK